MVAPEEAPPNNTESTGTFGKLKQTLSSSLLTAQDRGIFNLSYSSRMVMLKKNFHSSEQDVSKAFFDSGY